MEETIKKSFGKAFKNLRETLDKDVTKEEIAAMFFELGWKAGVEDMNSSIRASIKILGGISRIMDKRDKLEC